MKIKWRQWKIIMTAVLGALLLTGCGLLSKENVKLRDLDFTVLSEEKIPEELKTVIAEKGTEPFQLTYSDNQNLYISIGYGEQKTGGYSIAVDALSDGQCYSCQHQPLRPGHHRTKGRRRETLHALHCDKNRVLGQNSNLRMIRRYKKLSSRFYTRTGKCDKMQKTIL